MRRILNDCGKHRTNVCLLASGALSGLERATLERHLATCPNCQNYYAELKQVTEPFDAWETGFSHIEASRGVQARWEEEFTAAVEAGRPAPILEWWQQMFWPCRRTWIGFAAVWLVILAINISSRNGAQSTAMKRSRPSPEMVRAYLTGEGFMAEWIKRDQNRVAEPLKPLLPAPRSERLPQMFRT